MFRSIADSLREVVSTLPGGELKLKTYKDPKIKPPRRKPAIKNKSNNSDYMKNYMKEYRGNGQDYQKIPDKVKEYRKEQRRKLKESLKNKRPLQAALLDQELTTWQKLGKLIDLDEFDQICIKRGFSEEEQKILAEELCDLSLIMF